MTAVDILITVLIIWAQGRLKSVDLFHCGKINSYAWCQGRMNEKAGSCWTKCLRSHSVCSLWGHDVPESPAPVLGHQHPHCDQLLQRYCPQVWLHSELNLYSLIYNSKLEFRQNYCISFCKCTCSLLSFVGWNVDGKMMTWVLFQSSTPLGGLGENTEMSSRNFITLCHLW